VQDTIFPSVEHCCIVGIIRRMGFSSAGTVNGQGIYDPIGYDGSLMTKQHYLGTPYSSFALLIFLQIERRSPSTLSNDESHNA